MANLEMRQIATYLGIHISYITYSITLKKFISGSMCAATSFIYRKIASSNTSRLEAHAGFFRSLMKGIFDPYVL